jgi:uncharacterized membrane protein
LRVKTLKITLNELSVKNSLNEVTDEDKCEAPINDFRLKNLLTSTNITSAKKSGEYYELIFGQNEVIIFALKLKINININVLFV